RAAGRSWTGFVSAGQMGLRMDGPAAYLWALGRSSVRGQRSPFAVSIRGSWLAAHECAQREDGYERWLTACRLGVALRHACGAAGYRRRVVVGFVASREFVRGLHRALSHARARSSAGGERISAPAICSVAARLVTGAVWSPGLWSFLCLHRPNE